MNYVTLRNEEEDSSSSPSTSPSSRKDCATGATREARGNSGRRGENAIRNNPWIAAGSHHAKITVRGCARDITRTRGEIAKGTETPRCWLAAKREDNIGSRRCSPLSPRFGI